MGDMGRRNAKDPGDGHSGAATLVPYLHKRHLGDQGGQSQEGVRAPMGRSASELAVDCGMPAAKARATPPSGVCFGKMWGTKGVDPARESGRANPSWRKRRCTCGGKRTFSLAGPVLKQLGNLNSAGMGKDKAAKVIGTRAITQYTTPRQSTRRLTLRVGKNEGDLPGSDTVEATRADLMNTIQGLHSALEQQVETIPPDVLPTMPLRWETDHFRYLGVMVAHTSQCRNQLNIESVISGLESSMRFWNSLPLSIMGRVASMPVYFAKFA
ncbi:hypothetical protein NDU88_005970 [Pleurodeles waltl]|uniref:Uncharacterized protein n=1 Tax=Pleurodeles waltl TaxID=8319 RepID=A0AAV7WWT3_PLEWA|nr:hypothetical protein NDU88_005970 [Pleurodeles waltl]